VSAAGPPEVPSEPMFHHVDDIAWTPVQRQRNADGSESVIRERWPIIRPGFLSAYVVYEPGMVVRRHGHRSNHVVILLAGGAWLAGEWCGAGTHVHVPLGAAFGPIVAGPDGVTCWELSFGEFGGWGDRPELFDGEIVARGVTPLPDPPIEIGDWFVDPRGDWGAERPSPKVDGLAEVVTHLDALPAEEVAPGVHVVRAIAEPAFGSSRIALAANARFALGPDRAHRLALVTGGTVTVGARPCPAGTHVEVPSGWHLEPVVAGPDGATLHFLADG